MRAPSRWSGARLGVVLAVVLPAITVWLSARPAHGADPTIVTIAAAGDIYGGTCAASPCSYDKTADAVLGLNPTAALALGDISNVSGAVAEYTGPIDASWGRFKDRISPVPGNHDYVAPGAQNYYDYFGTAAHPPDGYYSLSLGAWHVIALNSVCAQVGGCDRGSPQETWLRSDLATDTAACTLAVVHHPRYSSGVGGDNLSVADLWQDLYDAHVDVVLSGHSHFYERFAPQDNAGRLDLTGVAEFVVGTGGASFSQFGAIEANSRAHDNTTYGVLGMTLGTGWYSFRFRPIVGGSYADSGSATCHSAPTSTVTVPDAPTGLSTAIGDGRVDLSWAPPPSDGGSPVTRYVVYRSTAPGPRGTMLGTVTGTSFVDTTVTNGTTYYYEVAAGNAVSDGPESAPVSARPHGSPTVSITATPAAATYRTDAAFSFTTSDPVGLPLATTCQLDGQPEAACDTGQAYFATLADGGHTFRVTTRDTDGFTGTTAYAWTVDTVAPTAALTAPATAFTTGPLVVSWSANGTGSAVAASTVRYRRARYDARLSGWVYPTSWAELTSTTLTSTAPAGTTTCFSVRARDAAGNLSRWSAVRCTAVPIDDRSLAAAGGWTRATGAAFYRQTITSTRVAGATLIRRAVTASRLALIATKCARCGTVRVLFVGRVVATVRLYAARVHRQVVIALPPFARRTGRLTIQVVSAGRVVQIDGVGITRV